VSAGTSLRVTPHVFKDAEGVRIKMLVAVEDGSVTGQEVDDIPVVHRASINTQAMIYEGESLLIGGLTRESSENNTDKVPGLGSIPVIGNLFKYKRDTGARIERMFLISPRLATRRPAGTTPSANMNSRVQPQLQARSAGVPPLPAPPPNTPPPKPQSAPPIVAPTLRPEAPVVTPPATSSKQQQPSMTPSNCGSTNGCEPSAMVVPSRWQSSTRQKGG
jgi:type III secretion protein C